MSLQARSAGSGLPTGWGRAPPAPPGLALGLAAVGWRGSAAQRVLGPGPPGVCTGAGVASPRCSPRRREGRSLSRSLPARTWPESELSPLSRFEEKKMFQGNTWEENQEQGRPLPNQGEVIPQFAQYPGRLRAGNQGAGIRGLGCHRAHWDKPACFSGPASSSVKGTHGPCPTSQGRCKGPVSGVRAESDEGGDAERHGTPSASGVRLAGLVPSPGSATCSVILAQFSEPRFLHL